MLGLPPRLFDVVLGADVCYSGMSQVPSLFDDSSEEDDGNECHAWENSANVAQTLAWCMAQPYGVAHLFVHEGRSPDEVARFISRADELGMVTVREPLRPELLTSTAPDGGGTGTDTEAAAEGAKGAAVLHDYMQEEGLLCLVVRWRAPPK